MIGVVASIAEQGETAMVRTVIRNLDDDIKKSLKPALCNPRNGERIDSLHLLNCQNARSLR